MAAIGDPAGFVAALRVQPAVASVDVLDRCDATVLLRVRWTGPGDVVERLGEVDLALLDLVGDDEEWPFRLRGGYDVVEALDRYCLERGTAFELRRLYEPNGGAAMLGPRVNYPALLRSV